MVEQSLSSKVIRNTLYNILGRVWTNLVGLFLSFYIIRHIGKERFGIWAIIGVITTYIGLLDFGIESSFVKYISEFYARKDYKRINEIVNTGFLFYFLFALLVIILSFFIIRPVISFLKIPPNLYGEALFVFSLGIIIFAISNCLSVFMAIPVGLQRIDIANKIIILLEIPIVIGTIFFLEKGYGLAGLMINNAIILLISGIANILVVHKILPEFRFNPCQFSKEIFRKIFQFGYNLQIAKISSMISFHFDKLLIGYFFSIGWVTFYQLGSTVIDMVRAIPLLLIPALLPAFSEMDAKGERKKLIDGYLRGTKYLAIVAIPLFTFIYLSAPQIMLVWMGAGFDKSAYIIRVLSFGWLAAVSAGVVGVTARAIGKPQIEMRAGIVAAISGIPLSILFVSKFGFKAVGFGTAISLTLAATYFFVKLHQELGLSFEHFLKTGILKIAAICLCFGLLFGRMNLILQNTFMEFNRLSNLVSLIIQFGLFFCVYLAVLMFIKPFDSMDISFLFKKVPKFVKNFGILFSRDF